VLAYVQLAEMDRLRDAREMDTRYHTARLAASAFHEPERIWTEHEQIRAALLSPHDAPREMSRDEWLDRVAAIDRKMRLAGLVPPQSGVMN
jgi:hypothetical protein